MHVCVNLVHWGIHICYRGFKQRIQVLFVKSHPSELCVDMLAMCTPSCQSVFSVLPRSVCASSYICEAWYMKSEIVKPCSGASEFICIHSTACLSSEPILITSSSGLLQHYTYSLPLSVEKWAAGGAFF